MGTSAVWPLVHLKRNNSLAYLPKTARTELLVKQHWAGPITEWRGKSVVIETVTSRLGTYCVSGTVLGVPHTRETQLMGFLPSWS